MKAMYVQIKAAGGQVIAPGAWREDGKRYASHPDHPLLVTTFAMEELPAVPQPLLDLQSERGATSSETATTGDIADLIEKLKIQGPSDIEGVLIALDLAGLAKKDAEFRAVVENPGEDTSINRFNYLKCVYREYGDGLSPADYLALCINAVGMGDFVGGGSQKAGEFNFRNFARDFLRSNSSHRVSDGSSFGVVVEDDAPEIDTCLPDHYVRSLADKAEKKQNAKLPLEWLDDFCGEQTPIDWLIEDLIELPTVGIVYGVPGAAKTVNLLDMALRIAHGMPWQGRDVRQRAVLYVAQEGSRGFARRIRAWRLNQERQGVDLGTHKPFVAVRRQINLIAGDMDYKAIRAAVDEIEARYGLKVGLIVIDTLRAAMVGGDENRQADTSIIMAAMNRLAITTGAAIVAAHHSGKDETKGASGSTNIIGSADWALQIEDHGDFTGTIRTKKMRDADNGQEFGFRTFGVEVGTDEKGRSQTAVVADCAPLRDKKTRKPAPASKGTIDAVFGDVSAEDAGMEAEGAGRGSVDVSQAVAADLADAIAAAVVASPVKADGEGWKAVADIAEHCEPLAAMVGPHLARKLKSHVFGTEPFVKTKHGRLCVLKARGRNGTLLRVDRP